MFWMILSGVMTGISLLMSAFYFHLDAKYSSLLDHTIELQEDIENLKALIVEEQEKLEAHYEFERGSG